MTAPNHFRYDASADAISARSSGTESPGRQGPTPRLCDSLAHLLNKGWQSRPPPKAYDFPPRAIGDSPSLFVLIEPLSPYLAMSKSYWLVLKINGRSGDLNQRSSGPSQPLPQLHLDGSARDVLRLELPEPPHPNAL